MSSEYERLKKRLEESCRKEEARQRAIERKKAEKHNIRKSGGGHAIARALMPEDTDFNYGQNEVQSDEDHCMGSVRCSQCGKHHGYCREIEEEKEKLKMLPTGNEAQSGTRRKASGMDWLKNEDLSVQSKEAKILMVRYNQEGRFGARVEMKLALDGKIKYWGVPPRLDDKNPNYRILTEKFGHNENDWVDQRILLSLEKDEFTQQYFVHVDFPKPSNVKADRR